MKTNKLYKYNYNYNSKVTVGVCLRDQTHKLKRRRNDAKFCSDLCKKHYDNERKEKGYTKLVFKGNKESLDKFFNMEQNGVTKKTLFNHTIRKDKIIIEQVIAEKGLEKSWYHDTPDFRLEYIASNPKNTYVMYYTPSRKNELLLCLLKLPLGVIYE